MNRKRGFNSCRVYLRRVAQSGRAPVSHSGCRRFKPNRDDSQTDVWCRDEGFVSSSCGQGGLASRESKGDKMRSSEHSRGHFAVMVALIGCWTLGLVPVFADDPFAERFAKQAGSDQGRAGSATFLQRWFRRRDGQWEQHWSVHDVREGDSIFFQCQSRLWQATFATFGSPGPTHVAIVVKMDDGQLGLLQAVDPQLKIKPTLKHPDYKAGQVCLSPDVTGFLRQYDGRIWVRPLRGSLHQDTSQRLTAWARHQVGKPYGMDKLIGSPLGLPVQVLHLGGPAQVDGHWWFCSELVASGLVVTGHMSPWHVRPSRVDPLLESPALNVFVDQVPADHGVRRKTEFEQRCDMPVLQLGDGSRLLSQTLLSNLLVATGL